MWPRRTKDESRRSLEAEQHPEEGVGEVGFCIDLVRLSAHLEVARKRGSSLDEALDTWLPVGEGELALNNHYRYVFEVRLPWWSYLRNFWAIAFFIQSRRLRSRHEVMGTSELEHLDVLLCRAEFSSALSVRARRNLRHQIECGAISRWSALSMMRSFGCKITGDGDPIPNPLGRRGLVLGSTICFVLLGLCVLFSILLGVELSQHCLKLCAVAGASQLLVMTGYLAALSSSLTWGRQRRAKFLARVVDFP